MSIVKGPDEAQEKNQRFEELVNLHQVSILRMCFMHLRDLTLAEDAVQETFFKAYKQFFGLSPKEDIKHYEKNIYGTSDKRGKRNGRDNDCRIVPHIQ